MSVNAYDAELYDAVGDLMDAGQLEIGTPAYGIAQQVVTTGYNSLTLRQRTLFDVVVVPALQKRGEEIRLLEIMSSAAP